MHQIRTFVNVPIEKLNQLVKDLEFEVDVNDIKVKQTSTHMFQVDVYIDDIDIRRKFLNR